MRNILVSSPWLCILFCSHLLSLEWHQVSFLNSYTLTGSWGFCFMATAKAQVFTSFYIIQSYYWNSNTAFLFTWHFLVGIFSYNCKLYALWSWVLEYLTSPHMSQHGLFIKNNSWLGDDQGMSFRASSACTL